MVSYRYSDRLRDFSEWGQCQIMELLRTYQPVSEDEVFDLLVSERGKGRGEGGLEGGREG